MTTTTSSTSSTSSTLDIGGMTCASCVRRVEKALTRVDGVVDAVGQPGDRDRHRHLRPRPDRRSTELTAAVDKAGYTGRRAPTGADELREAALEPAADDRRTPRRDTEIAQLKRRWQVALTDRPRR